MNNWLYNPLKEFTSMSEVYNHDPTLINQALVSGIGIFLFFLLIGIMFVALAGKGPLSTGKKTTLTVFIGISFIVCAISRGLEVLALWHNYAYLITLFKDATCIFAAVSSAMLPSVIVQVRQQRTLEDVHRSMEKTAAKLEEVKQISLELKHE